MAQDEGEIYKSCDSLGRCFSTYATDGGVSFGIAVPDGATKAPFDVIIQVTALKSIGWAGIGWGGAMTYNPLTIVWPNGKDVVVSSRMGL